MGKLLYKIVGAFDTETTNIGNTADGYKAFPVLYQLGLLECDIKELTPDNAADLVNVSTYRDYDELYTMLDSVKDAADGYVPVLLVHNLSFDMFSLASYLNKKTCRVLAKTAQKPITITVTEDKKPVLVFLDTLGLYMKSLARMGEECHMQKAVGDWDYDLVRTPDTELTEQELHYAKRDIYTLLVYTSYFLAKNPDIDPESLGQKVMTKTGVVRAKRMKHLGALKGKGLNRTVNQLWNYHNRTQAPTSDNELFTMHACTRGGFTFCASEHASKVFEATDEKTIAAYDATSQHPAQMVSHMVPIDFSPATLEELELAAQIIADTDIERILKRWQRPFTCAVNACYRVQNLRPKSGSIYEKHGIFPLASARLNNRAAIYDNESFAAIRDSAIKSGYTDYAEDARIEFGKIKSASYAELWLTELALWELYQCYDFDSIEPVGGYMSTNFRKPTDLSILSVMRFYNAKNALKQTMHDGNADRLDGLFPSSFVDSIRDDSATEQDMKEYYLLSKADLNSLFGIEATNEYRRDFELTNDGIVLTGQDGICNAPKNPKCHYQFGQRIVGYSRIAQHVAMQLVEPYADAIICGDTDSFKLYLDRSNIHDIDYALDIMGQYIDNARINVTSRIKQRYHDHYADLEGLGYYVSEGEFSGFSASWNKSYITYDGSKVKTTIAGVPTSRGEHSIDNYGNELLKMGATFPEVASTLIGYNVTFDFSLTKLNGRKHPEWGEFFEGYVTDYKGDTYHVYAPAALAIYPEPKTIGNTESVENYTNSLIAKANNDLTNIEPVMLYWDAEGIGAEL